MGLPPLADVTRLETRLGHPVADVSQAEQLLGYASALVRSFAGRNWVDANGDLDDVPDPVRDVTVEVVYRTATNPDGVTQDTTGPFSTSYGPQAAQRMYLSASDRQIIRDAVSRPKVWTLGTSRGPLETRTVPVEGSDKPLPLDMPR